MELSLIGLQNAGKSSLVNVLTTGSFHEDMIPTVSMPSRGLRRLHSAKQQLCCFCCCCCSCSVRARSDSHLVPALLYHDASGRIQHAQGHQRRRYNKDVGLGRAGRRQAWQRPGGTAHSSQHRLAKLKDDVAHPVRIQHADAPSPPCCCSRWLAVGGLLPI